ncbi:hypothetical protein M0R19_05885 [Candidatus Pacearchaeota archaeon]|jgi:hypothetical protein|nr:hypothetical protein [Candidatus Pacearchaeota archaeon]
MIEKDNYDNYDNMLRRVQLLSDQFNYLLQEFKRYVSPEIYQNAIKRLNEISIEEE